MKKFKSLLLLALPLIFMASCSDSDDVPDVSIDYDITGYYQVPNDQTLYITPDCPLTVQSLSIVSLEGKPASLGNVAYNANGVQFYVTAIPPYNTAVPVKLFQEGKNMLTIQMNILVQGYSVYDAAMFFPVILVPDEESLPAGAVYVPNPLEDNTPEEAE